MKRFALVLLALSLAGCALITKPKTVDRFDFGNPKAGAVLQLAAPVALYDIRVPPWLATSAIHYRLPQAPYQLQAYGESGWLAAPGTLLELYLSPTLGAAYRGASTDERFRLYLELETLEQIFTSETRARVDLRLRAELRSRNGKVLIAQRPFSYSAESPSPDARGAVAATVELVDKLRDELLVWLEEKVNETVADSEPPADVQVDP